MVEAVQAAAAAEPDPFASAFEQLRELGDKPVPADMKLGETLTPEEIAKKAEEEAAAAAAAAEAAKTPPADDKTDIDDEPAEAVDDPPPQTQEDKDAALIERVAKIMGGAKPPAEKTEPEPQQQQEAQPQPQPTVSADEQAALAGFEKEHPEVAQATQIMLRVAMQHTVGHVFKEMSAQLGPLVAAVRELSTMAQLEQLRAVDPEYDDVRDKVAAWVGTQPAYLQTAFNRVIQEGTVDEVADLITRYRQSTGTQAPARQQVPAGGKKEETELPAATRKAVAALAPVSSKRSAVVTSAGPTDFDGAFADFAALAEKV